jgi:hypothetical protein
MISIDKWLMIAILFEFLQISILRNNLGARSEPLILNPLIPNIVLCFHLVCFVTFASRVFARWRLNSCVRCRLRWRGKLCMLSLHAVLVSYTFVLQIRSLPQAGAVR